MRYLAGTMTVLALALAPVYGLIARVRYPDSPCFLPR